MLDENDWKSRRDRLVRSVVCVAISSALFSLAGCSLFVMGGQMLLGRPTIPAAFTEFTKKSLGDKGTKTVVICKAPLGSDRQTAALDHELQAEISRRLKQHDIEVVNSGTVLSWIDDNGGEWGTPSELFDEFDEADFLIVVDVNEFSYLEKNSPGFYRGRSQIEVSVFENDDYDAKIFTHTIDSQYPEHNPEIADRVNPHAFRKRYVDHLSRRIARLFYDYRPEENVE